MGGAKFYGYDGQRFERFMDCADGKGGRGLVWSWSAERNGRPDRRDTTDEWNGLNDVEWLIG